MRISILCGGNKVFGLEVMALTAARELRARGHEIFVVANAWNDGEFCRRLTEAKIPFQTMFFGKVSKSLRLRPLWWSLNALVRLPGARRQLRRHFESFRPDAVVVYNRDLIFLTRSILPRQRSIFYVHELQEPSNFAAKIYHAIDESTSSMIAVSQFIADRLADLGVERRRVSVIYNGVEPPNQSGPSSGEPQTLTIGIVGQVGEWKGHEDLITALHELRETASPFRCVVFGRGDPEYMSQLTDLAKQLNVDDIIDWRGYVSDPEAIYQEIDICVVPSRCEEACPVVAIEAALRGKPVVATRRGGLPELVMDGLTGFLVDPRSPEQLADRLRILLGDSQARRKMGEAGRRRASEEFTAPRMAEQIEVVCSMLTPRGEIQLVHS